VVVVDTVTGPTEELECLSQESITEFEDLFVVLWCDIDAKIFQRFLDG
jgi:hypothetical protein